MLVLTIPLAKFKYHRLQITDKRMWFLGILEQPCPNNIYEIDHDFLFPIDPAKSGKKIAG